LSTEAGPFPVLMTDNPSGDMPGLRPRYDRLFFTGIQIISALPMSYPGFMAKKG